MIDRLFHGALKDIDYAEAEAAGIVQNSRRSGTLRSLSRYRDTLVIGPQQQPCKENVHGLESD